MNLKFHNGILINHLLYTNKIKHWYTKSKKIDVTWCDGFQHGVRKIYNFLKAISLIIKKNF